MACTPAHSRPEGFTVRDDLGRTVTVPETADRVISLQPEASRILVALGCARSLVGIDYFLKKYDNIFRDIMPGAEDLPVVAYEDASVDMESVIQLNPDLIFASPYDAHIPDSLQAKTGKPVVAVSSLGSIDNLLREIRLIGRVMGRSERAEELVGFFKTQTDQVSRVVRAVPAQDGPASTWPSGRRSAARPSSMIPSPWPAGSTWPALWPPITPSRTGRSSPSSRS
jgi:iron complex transport system substrate-binding protein